MSIAKLLGIDESSPTYIAAKQAAKDRHENAETHHCKNGCANWYDPGSRESFGGFGVAGCREPECNGEPRPRVARTAEKTGNGTP